ncbi:pentatricopeptide repeat-containing protein At1g30610, chloroplastic isoform X2 [Prosopis cineraria]|uniref:pentatricopeptide repeat-containing protein At1g30610, chloroplastic isoform X2 n=1 Tax=Prosopis cineraria TaxID=364024 RepID=UPI00240F1BDD|nr:pentatricopeptide repeat-containing protein At1g30610, chloroplastic isoform X2 [Prosopis cineraria]
MGGVSFEISRNSAFAMHCYGNSFSSGVTVSWRPFLGTSLDTRTARKYQVFHAQKLNYGPACASSKSVFNAGLISDGLVSSELEFKPSFDDYLKEMDSARADKEKLSSRNVRVKKHAANTENQKREKVMSRKPRLEGVEKSTKLEKLGGHVDKTNELGFAEKNGALQVVETVLGKESSSVGHIKLRPRGAKRREPEYDGEESKLDSAVKQKKEAEVIEDRWLECRINRSKPDSDGSLFKRERRRTGNSKASLNRNSNCGNTIEVEVGHEVQSLKMVGEKDVTTRQICCNSKGKMPMINKTVVSNNGIHNGREKICTKNENVGKENGWENLNLNGSIRCYGYDNLEVERAAFKTFEELNGVVNKPQVSHKETEDRIQRLANSLNGADINMPEWIFSKMMRSAKIKFNDYSIVRVIQRLGKLGNWQRVIQVIEWLQRRERFKSHKLRHIYTAALDALGKARRPIEALNVFHAMLQQLSTYPDLVAYRSIAVTLGQAGHMKELFDVIDIMRLPPKKKFKVGALGNWDPRLEPDVVVYNAVLNACVQQKQWEGAFWVLQQLKKQRQQPSTTTSGLVMEVMFTCGKYDLVHEFFMKVQKFSIPNALTYRVLVNTLWKEGKTDEAILAVQDMERRGVVGSASLYYDLARCLCAAGRCGEALMQEEPIETTWKHLIQTDRIIPATLIKERFCMKLEKDDHVEALRCITSDLSKDMQAFSKLSWLNLLKENAQRFQKDTLVRLMDDVNTLVSKSSLSLPALEALENLMLSWKEICTLTLV